jgi:hypothetical protein
MPFEGLGIVTVPVTFNVIPELMFKVVVPLFELKLREAQLALSVTVIVSLASIVTLSLGPTPPDLKLMLLWFEAALLVKVRLVLLAIEAIVPRMVPVVVRRVFPTANSVVNKVPEPVTVVEELDVVMVPARFVVGLAQVPGAFQLPDVMDVIE